MYRLVKLYVGETLAEIPPYFDRERVGVDFLNFLNNWITVAESQGWLAERYDYWFRTVDWESRIK